jgi:hypothetical protein
MTGNGARLKFRQRKGRRSSHANLHQRGTRNHSARATDSRLIFSDWTAGAVTSAFGASARGSRFLISNFTTCATRWKRRKRLMGLGLRRGRGGDDGDITIRRREN